MSYQSVHRWFWCPRTITAFRQVGCLVTIVLVALTLFNSSVPAQGTTSGGFKGIVRDKNTGSPVAGAKVVLRNQRFGTQATVITDENGAYLKSSLPPGDYDIEVSASGYLPQKKVQTLYAMANYSVEPDPFEMVPEGSAPPPTPVVQPGQPAPRPTPASIPAPAVAPTQGSENGQIELNPRRGAIFDDRLVVGLPLGSTTLTRSFDELAFLVPGVNPPPQAIGNSVGPGIGGGVGTSGQFSVNGLRSRANNFTVDGSDNNDEDIGVRRQGFFTLVPQPVESVQEFQIITLLAPAEFGRNLGAQVNALSKSGGNQVRGSVYGFLNSDKLNARNFFDNTSGNSTRNLTGIRFNGSTAPVFVDGVQKQVSNPAGSKDKLRLLQGGFAVGGKLVRDRMFFFLSGEAQDLNGTRERSFAVPTVAQRGLFDSAAAGLQQCQGVLVNNTCRDPQATGTMINYSRGFPTSLAGDAVFSLFPFPNDPGGVYGANTHTQELSTDATGRVFSGKYDYNFKKFGQDQIFTARYNYTGDKRDLTDVGGALFSAIRPVVRTDNFSSYWTGGLTNNISNELRFSWGRTKLRFDELPDTTGFLVPVTSSKITNAGDRRFLLNARVVENRTLPVNCTPTGCFAPSQANYVSTGFTQNSSLGPIGQLIIGGFSPVGVDVFNFPQQRRNDTIQIADTLRWRLGNHLVSMGTDIRPVFLDSDLPRNSRPLVTFYGGALASLDANNNLVINSLVTPQSMAAAGAAGGFFQSIAASGKDARIKLRYQELDFFGQDDWRVTRRIDVHFGLRYEYNTVPRESSRKIESTFGQQFTGQGFSRLKGLTNFLNGRARIFDGDRNNFAPRLGFAFAPTSSVVMRVGYGVYYDQVIGSVVSQSRNVFPTFTTANFGGGLLIDNDFIFTLFNPLNAVFDPAQQIVCNLSDAQRACGASSIPLLQPGSLNAFNSALTPAQFQQVLEEIWSNFPALNGTTFGATIPARTLKTPFSHQYSIGLDYRLRFARNDAVISAAYVGTSGRNLLRSSTPNLGANFIMAIDSDEGIFLDNGNPSILGFTIDPYGKGQTFERPNPNIGPVNSFQTTGRSRYDSVQLGFRGRFGRSFQYQTNYVFGVAKDDASDVFDLAGSSALPQNSVSYNGEYDYANFDVRHRFTYHFAYGLPRFNDQNEFMRGVLGGWEVAGTGRFNTGQPFTVNTVYDVNHDGNLTDRLNNLRFITLTGNRQQPLSLQSGADLTQMLAAFGQDGSVGRNSFRTGSVLELDMTLSRRFRIKEGQDLQFRADFFNFINHANFGVPVRVLEFPSFGKATETITPGRRIQFALKYNF